MSEGSGAGGSHGAACWELTQDSEAMGRVALGGREAAHRWASLSRVLLYS